MSTSHYEPVWEKGRILFENRKLPSSLRLIICGDSNAGKGFLLMRLLLEGYLDYNHLYIFSPSLHQTEYQILVKSFEAGLHKSNIIALYKNKSKIIDPFNMINMVASRIKEKSEIKVQAFEKDELIPKTTELDKTEKNLFIFDDCAFEKQSNIHGYFTKGRHNNINCVYLTQNYFELPRRSIRGNSNCFIFFKLKMKDVQHIWQDLASDDFPDVKDFKEFCKETWSKDHGYLFIDTTQKDVNKKYVPNYFDPSSSHKE